MTGVMKKIPTYSFLLAALLLPHTALAQIVITEIMYDPPHADSGREWIEVFNAGTSTIPLTGWKLHEGDANHNIIASLGSTMLTPQAYAVIAESVAKFSADHPDFSGSLFHSAFSLDNVGETIELFDASSSLAEYATYDSSQGALGDGNSLQRIPDDAADFSPHTPTPGAAISPTIIAPKVKAAAPAKASIAKKAPTKKTSLQAASNDAGNMDVVTAANDPVAPQSQAALAAVPGSNDSYWWLALLVLGVFAGGAMAVSKRFKKTEWDIVEEKPEDV